MKLRELQEAFQNYVIALDSRISPFIGERPGVPAASRLEIYAEAYRLRLVEVLANHYPGLRARTGVETFDRIAVSYVDRHPSSHFSVRCFGDGLEEYLAQTSPYQECSALAEMARFEWALAAALDCADSATVDRSELIKVPADQWPYLRFCFHPGVQRLDLRCNVVAVWKAVTAGEEPPSEHTGAPQPWLVWRRRLNPQFRSLSKIEAGALDAALLGRSFAGICEQLSEDLCKQDVPAEAATILSQWVDEGLITQIQIAAA